MNKAYRQLQNVGNLGSPDDPNSPKVAPRKLTSFMRTKRCVEMKLHQKRLTQANTRHAHEEMCGSGASNKIDSIEHTLQMKNSSSK
jgi:hypothetical protein